LWFFNKARFLFILCFAKRIVDVKFFAAFIVLGVPGNNVFRSMEEGKAVSCNVKKMCAAFVVSQ